MTQMRRASTDQPSPVWHGSPSQGTSPNSITCHEVGYSQLTSLSSAKIFNKAQLALNTVRNTTEGFIVSCKARLHRSAPYSASPGRQQRGLGNSCGTAVPAASLQKPDGSITHSQQGYGCFGGGAAWLALPHSGIQLSPLIVTLQSQNSFFSPSFLHPPASHRPATLFLYMVSAFAPKTKKANA